MAAPFDTSGRRDGYRPRPDDADLRCSDQERNEINDLLCRHFADGRLTDAELEQRLAAVTSAKTRRELWAQLTDLPRLPGAAGGPPDPGAATPWAPGRRPWPSGRHDRRGGPGPWRLVLGAILVLSVVGAVHSFHLFPLVFVAAVLLFLDRRHRRRRCLAANPPGDGGGWGGPVQRL